MPELGDVIQSVRSFKRYAWLAGSVVVVVIFAYCAGTCHSAPAGNPKSVDSLTWVNQSLAQQNSALVGSMAQLQKQKDSVQHSRDSVKAAADSAEARLQRGRHALPVPPTVVDSDYAHAYASLRGSYVLALAWLDSASATIAQKNEVIHADSVAQARSDSITVDLRAQLLNTTTQYQNEQRIAVKWKTAFESQSHCQFKCGMVLGVLETIGAAVAVRQVQQVFVKRP